MTCDVIVLRAAAAVPTLVIHGRADHGAPLALTGEPTARLVPGSRLEVYPGCAPKE